MVSESYELLEQLKEQIVDGYIGLFTGLRGEPNSSKKPFQLFDVPWNHCDPHARTNMSLLLIIVSTEAVLLNDLEKVFILIRAIYFADDTYEETRYKCVLMIG